MKWKKYTLKTLTSAEDVVSAVLADLGIEGVQIEDHKPLTSEERKQMFVDIMPEGPADDGVARISFYLDAEADHQEIMGRVCASLADLSQYMDLGDCSIEESETEEQDWINNWKAYFHQFYVDDMLIIPSWEDVKSEDEGKMILHIDPGTAFGTGMHETTQLCMRALKKYVTPQTALLDVGTGSGILGIVALKLGAAYVFGTDLDPCAAAAVRENLSANGIDEKNFTMLIGDLIDEKAVQDAVGYERYDLVTANILTDVLERLTPEIVRHLKPGGIYITSGILDSKEEEMCRVIRSAGLELMEVTRQGEWVSFTARKDLK